MKLDFKRLPLPAGEGPIPPTAMDAHFAWAAATGFQFYGGKALEQFLVAFEMRIIGPRTEAALTERCLAVFTPPQAILHPIWWNADSLYGTALVTKQGLERVLQAAAAPSDPGVKPLVTAFQLALIPVSQRPVTGLPALGAKKLVVPETCRQPVLYGVIDNGCPFASTRLRERGRTRIVNLWDQEGAFRIRSAQPNQPDVTGSPHKWKFGASCGGPALDAYCAGRPPSDDWALYREAGLPGLARDASHGAHVLGSLFGAHANPALLWCGVRDHVPVPKKPRPFTGPDLVFVQLPSAYIQGMPRTALGPYRLAALRYILECAGPETTRVVVPVSSENYDGSHDGESLFERASDAMVAFAGTRDKDLVLLVSAGNSLRANAHEVVELNAAKRTHEFRVRVLPGTERQTFVEVWVPHSLKDIEFALQAPGDTSPPQWLSGDGSWGASVDGVPVAGIVSLLQPSGASVQRCVLFVLPPTLVRQGSGGVAGDWRISVKDAGNAKAEVCAFIARMTPGLGGKYRGHQSTFPRLYSRSWDFANKRPAGSGRPYESYSLNGMATGKLLWAVGGYQLRIGDRAEYSSAGPGRGPSRHAAFLIDAAAPSDESSSLPGIPGWGNRSGGNVRLAGTSVAAPLAARALAPATSPPRPNLPVGVGDSRKDPQVPVARVL